MGPIDKAFAETPRRNFLPEDYLEYADVDNALPIGFGQTISQPYTVGLMLEWLEVAPGDKVLDVGSGSGWTTALLSHLTGSEGKVYAVEIIPELVEFGRSNNRRLGIKNASFYQAGRHYGLPKYAPYDRILVSAEAQSVPKELLDQLKPGGKMVIPVDYDILEIEKPLAGEPETTAHNGFVFVPLVQPQ
jgi:protein-L-isoaspartate(D-aspartate) O-methyltransferase